jgi:hypothetical protein
VFGLGDRELDLPTEAHPFLADMLTRSAAFTAASIGCEVDDASRVVLVRRLAAEGVVVPD